MGKYFIRRLLGLIPLFIAVVVISFFLMQFAPGGPEQAMKESKKLTNAQIERWLNAWCLEGEDSIVATAKEFGGWAGILNCNNDGWNAFFSEQGGLNFLPRTLGGGDNGILHGDFGRSIANGREVLGIITERLPATLLLAGVALFVWVSLALVIGVIAAVRQYGIFDQVSTFLSYIFYSLPTFWLGLMLIFFFAVFLHWFPTSGMVNAREWPPFGTPDFGVAVGKDPLGAIKEIGSHMVLPLITLVAVNIAGDSRFVRASMLDVLNQDYVRTAKAKGAAPRRVYGRHALRNALLPVVTNVGLELPFLVAGAIVTETIFVWPGMGSLFIQSLRESDYFVLMAVIMITSAMILFANLVADLVYGIVDPRIRY
jgi:peptide/nickel transport system permease protein